MITSAMGAPGDPNGTFTNAPGTSTSAIDTNRFDADGAWDSSYLMDTTVGGGLIARIKSWALTGSTFTLYAGFASPGASSGDSYELTKLLSFPELRRAINAGIALCGPTLRTWVRDETKTVQANTYQYAINSSASPNRFFPRGVTEVALNPDPGRPTQPFPSVPFDYIDDDTINLPVTTVDTWVGMTLRLSGVGPVATFLTSDDPAQTIGTFEDDFAVEYIVAACTFTAWNMVAAKQTTGENPWALQMAQIAQQIFRELKDKWRRGSPTAPMVAGPGSLS